MREFNSLRSPHFLRARLTASRRPLKPVCEAQFLGPQPPPAGAIWRRGVPRLGVPRNAEVPGSRPGRPASFLAGIVQRKGQNATNVQIGVRFLIPVPDLRPVVQFAQDAALRTLKFRFDSGGLDQHCGAGWYPGRRLPIGAGQFSELEAVVAERQRRPIVYRDQKGSTPFHRAMRS